MLPEVAAVLVVVVLVIGLYTFMGTGRNLRGLSKAMETARKQNDPVPIVSYITGQDSGQEDLWDQAIVQLWNSYDRLLVARLLVEALMPVEKQVVAVGDSAPEISVGTVPSDQATIKILHYWVNQVLQIEPEIAEAVFTEQFMNEGFRPELAMCCGSGCGCKI